MDYEDTDFLFLKEANIVASTIAFCSRSLHGCPIKRDGKGNPAERVKLLEQCIQAEKLKHQITYKDGHGRDDFHTQLKNKNREDNSNCHTHLLMHFRDQT